MQAKIFNYKKWIKETEPKKLKKYFDNALKKNGHTVISFTEHNFKPQGYTAIWLLSESHFALHTFPEHNKTYIELSSCNKFYFKSFKDIIKNDK